MVGQSGAGAVVKQSLVFNGMQGMGDNLHQRAILRQLVAKNDVWLKTPWPQIYHDMPDLHLAPSRSRLRTQSGNEEHAAYLYDTETAPANARFIGCKYSPESVRRIGSVLGAMSESCKVPVGDFRMPVLDEWRASAAKLLPKDRPTLAYRPLVARREWGGHTCRNPDADAYNRLLSAISGAFYVVSVADLKPREEWMVSLPIKADAEYHAGELDFETLAGLFSLASLVFSAPGFAVVLAQAVGTPAITVFGGYEDSRSFSAGSKFTPWLPIEPVNPCACWSHSHSCDKRIDTDSAIEKVKGFAHAAHGN
jgi:ADP-heptose:LPS heptosyltransferase